MYMFFHLFLAHKVGLFSVHWFPVVLGLTKLLILEALFTFPIKCFMQELIHSMLLSRFHIKDHHFPSARNYGSFFV